MMAGWQRQAESSELADGIQAQKRAIGKLALAAATHGFGAVGVSDLLRIGASAYA